MSRSSDSVRRDAWRERFQRFSGSGLSVARFCSRERVSMATFYYWRKKLGGQAPVNRRTTAGAFRQVTVVPSVSGVSIQLPGGARIEVHTDDLDAVRAVVAEVARAGGALQTSAAPC